MSRYIDVNALAEEIKSLTVFLGGKDIFEPEAKATVLRIIDDQPTADVAEVVRATKLSFVDRKDSLNGLYTCSNCGMSVVNLPNYNFCEKCGARMDGESS